MPVKKDSIQKDTPKKKGKPENLDPCRDTETAKARGKQGGIQSGIAKKEKKLMSQILADYLQKEHEVILRDDNGDVIDREKLSADELIQRTITAVMARGDSASVQMMKTIAETTEGKNINLAGSLSVTKYDLSKLSTEELRQLDKLTGKVDTGESDTE